ncbi:hypothetical protein [Nocardia thailandica]|uniref:hypothetical protein n=1 Tax=Nocardia thailandica TaxID=257275 RepID=UPI000300E561|nr:hypothetical protein [Nocardia thailandica]
MRSYRLLTILLALLAVVVTATFVAITHTDTDSSSRGRTSPSPAPSSGLSATSSAVPTSRPPTVDLYGNRLEVPATDAGTARPQAGTPIDPGRPDYLCAAPEGLQWQRIWNGAAVPVSTGDGPARVQDGIASGFARTPQGAVLAGLDAFGRALSAPEGVWQQVVRQRYYIGDPADALVARFQRSRANTPDAARYVVVPDGVRVQAGYDPDMAVVEIASRSGSGYAVSAWPMAWIDGDWRVRVPDDLESLWRPNTFTAASLTGFGTWKPRP